MRRTDGDLGVEEKKSHLWADPGGRHSGDTHYTHCARYDITHFADTTVFAFLAVLRGKCAMTGVSP
jgi:hypothetical protein